MTRLLRIAFVAVLLAAHAVPSLAAEGVPGATRRSDGATPAERKARIEQWCKDHPEKCRPAQQPGGAIEVPVIAYWWGGDSTRAFKGRWVPLDILQA